MIFGFVVCSCFGIGVLVVPSTYTDFCFGVLLCGCWTHLAWLLPRLGFDGVVCLVFVGFRLSNFDLCGLYLLYLCWLDLM